MRSRRELSRELTEIVNAAATDAPDANSVLSEPAEDVDVLAEAEEWVQRGDDLRARLLDERARKLAELRKIDETLAKLPGGRTQADLFPLFAAPPASRLPTGRTDTIPGLLLAIIGAHPGATAKDIQALAEKKRPKLQPRDTFANLYRLQKRRLIRGEGPRGATRYLLVGPGEGATPP